MRKLAASALLLASLLAAPAAIAAPAPQLGISSFNDLPQPLPKPYAETPAFNAQKALAAARKRAIAGRKLLLIDLGGNWCPDCRIVAGILDLPKMRPFVAKHFEVVMVDVGRYDKNMDVPKAYGLADRLAGVPSLLIVNPVNNSLINKGNITTLANARAMTPQAVAEWLAQWTKK